MSEFSVESLHGPEFWEQRYAGDERIWSGKVNQRLSEQAHDLTPGSALDLGCGEGGDAIWLAEHGWTVLAVDVAEGAVARARRHAEETLAPDVAARITWQRADVRTWQPPEDAFDLASLQFLHLPRETLAEVAVRLGRAVRTGGALLIVNHDRLDIDAGVPRFDIPELFLSADEISALLGDEWTPVIAEPQPRPGTLPDGTHVTLHDTVVRALRR